MSNDIFKSIGLIYEPMFAIQALIHSYSSDICVIVYKYVETHKSKLVHP